MEFKNGLKNIKTAGYIGAGMVYSFNKGPVFFVTELVS